MPTENPKTKDPRVIAGEARVRAALDHIQQAQVEVSRALSDLSAVIGYPPECDRLKRLYDKLKSDWYRLEAKLKAGPTKKHPGINAIDRNVTAEQADAIVEDPHNMGCGYHGWTRDFFGPSMPNRELAKRQGFG